MTIEVDFRHSMTCYSRQKRYVDQERTPLLIYGSQIVSEALSGLPLFGHIRLDLSDQRVCLL